MLQYTLPLLGIEDQPSHVYTIPESETPAARIAEHGASYCSDRELVALLCARSLSVDRAGEAARDILQAVGDDLAALARWTVSELAAAAQVGEATARTVIAAAGLAARISAPKKSAARLESPAQVADLMRETLRGKEQEEFHALLLNTKHALIRDETITIGLLDRSHVHAREVFRGAIRQNCARIVLVHNHPSGDPTPSHGDIASTNKLIEAGKVIGIEIMDHVVIGYATDQRQKDFVSFREEDLIKG